MVYHLFLQKSCFKCRFGALPRQGDLTLGDFWGIPEQWHQPCGDSVVLANTDKGKDIVRQLAEGKRITVKASDYATASRKVGRLRGALYPVPALRDFSLQTIADGAPFGRFYRLCYLPLRFGERLTSYVQRRVRILMKSLRQIWQRA